MMIQKNNDKSGLIEHLDDLRSCIIKIIIAIIFTSVISLFFTDWIFESLLYPLKQIGYNKLFFFSPYEAFFIKIKADLFFAVILAFPFIIFQIWNFISPGLYENEKKIALPVILVSFVLFLLGVFFSYFIVSPMTLKFFLSFEDNTMHALLSASKYFGYVMMMLFSFGLMFLMPIFLLMLMRAGIFSPQGLASKRKYIIIIILVVSAVFTPPDVLSQVLLAVPLYLLFELSLLVGKFINKR